MSVNAKLVSCEKFNKFRADNIRSSSHHVIWSLPSIRVRIVTQVSRTQSSTLGSKFCVISDEQYRQNYSYIAPVIYFPIKINFWNSSRKTASNIFKLTTCTIRKQTSNLFVQNCSLQRLFEAESEQNWSREVVIVTVSKRITETYLTFNWKKMLDLSSGEIRMKSRQIVWHIFAHGKKSY